MRSTTMAFMLGITACANQTHHSSAVATDTAAANDPGARKQKVLALLARNEATIQRVDVAVERFVKSNKPAPNIAQFQQHLDAEKRSLTELRAAVGQAEEVAALDELHERAFRQQARLLLLSESAGVDESPQN